MPLQALVKSDVDMARSVTARDDGLDGLKNQISHELPTYILAAPRTIEPSIDLVLISRHLERVGDQATNVAAGVIVIVEARDVRHHVDDRVE